jgi:hypothetical protein
MIFHRTVLELTCCGWISVENISLVHFGSLKALSFLIFANFLVGFKFQKKQLQKSRIQYKIRFSFLT